MTTPVGREVGETLEPMRNTMIDLLLVWIRLVVCFADTLGNDLRVTLAVTRILAVGALHAGSIFQEITTESTTHDIVKLLSDELVSLLFVDLFLLLTNGTLSVKTNIERSSILQLFGYTTG